ncbi:type I-F CRISPR-associated endoribonuclease Cas6/Csy4 [Pseudomonas aeruginosa]
MTGRRLFILGNSFSKPIPLNPFPFLYIPQFSRFTLLVYLTLSQERLRRRLMRRHDLSEEEARKRIPDTVARALDLPFVTLRSQSTGQHFRLFIRHGPLQATAEEGGFTCYGLSKGGFVPWF